MAQLRPVPSRPPAPNAGKRFAALKREIAALQLQITQQDEVINLLAQQVGENNLQVNFILDHIRLKVATSNILTPGAPPRDMPLRALYQERRDQYLAVLHANAEAELRRQEQAHGQGTSEAEDPAGGPSTADADHDAADHLAAPGQHAPDRGAADPVTRARRSH